MKQRHFGSNTGDNFVTCALRFEGNFYPLLQGNMALNNISPNTVHAGFRSLIFTPVLARVLRCFLPVFAR